MRVKRGVKARRRRKKILKLAKGFRGRSSNTIRQATQRVEKAMTYAYRDRRNKKRDFRRLWITRISGALENHQLSYSKLISGLGSAGVELNRKMLAEVGASDEKAFAAIVDVAKNEVASQ